MPVGKDVSDDERLLRVGLSGQGEKSRWWGPVTNGLSALVGAVVGGVFVVVGAAMNAEAENDRNQRADRAAAYATFLSSVNQFELNITRAKRVAEGQAQPAGS